MARIVVVGAGIAGLAAAHALRRHDVTIVDGASYAGGKLRTSRVAGIGIDEGAESFLARVPEGLGLARAVGLDAELVHPATAAASIWSRGRLHPLPARTLFGVPTSVRSVLGVLTAPETARVAADLALPDAGHDDDESVGALVGRRLGRAVVDRLVDPLLGGVYAGRADSLSVRATVPQLVTHGSLIRAARRSVPSPTAAPVFATLTGGMGGFAERVASASEASLILGRLVRRIERTAAGFRVVHGPTTDEVAIDADAVIVAVPAAPAARLLADLAPAAAADLAQIDSASMAIVTTVWRRADLSAATGSGYLVPPSAGRPVKAVTFASHKWAHLGTADLAAVRASIGRYGETTGLQRDDDELVEDVVDELTRTAGALGRPVESRVTRWGGALPQYAVGHLDRVRRIRTAVAAVPGLAVCGATYEGVGVPACIRTGQQAAERIASTLHTRGVV